ncbi:hypothetical protein HYX06_04300 [Candidatus Woesearchaeota archaeon]|nr:hypothetical protein [Candidatus Woesearchaeota archaeon]
MAYTQFQTDRADYVFYGTNHLYGRIQPNLFNGIDALVVEMLERNQYCKPIQGKTHDERFFLSTSLFGNRDLAEKMRKEGVTVLVVDVKLDSGKHSMLGYIREHLSKNRLVLLQVVPVMTYYSLSNTPLPAWAGELINNHHRDILGPTHYGRSAITAERIEEVAVPMLSEEHKGKRVKIGIIYGVAHQQIVDFLKSKELRGRVLEEHRKSGLKGFDPHDLEAITRFDYDGSRGLWMPREYKINMFSPSPA